MTYLAVFSLTPVQAFIARARKLRDFYAGSRILSYLAGVGLEAAGEAVYPAPGAESVPNKFVFTLEAENAEAVKERMRRIEDAVQAAWLGLAEIAGVPTDRVDDYWQYSWAAFPWDGNDYQKAHSKAQALLAATKLKPAKIRKPQSGKKCPLCGENAVWKKFSDDFGTEEELCGVCAIKRLLPEKRIPDSHPLRDLTRQENFPSTEDLAGSGLYYALLIMDGDRMGDLVNTKKTPEEHRALSEALETFIRSITKENLLNMGGRLIYAGGDDVCAVMPLAGSLDAAWNIRQSYRAAVGGTISAALVIAHHKEPLREVIRDTHRALDEAAKEKAGRDALVIRLKKRSGGDRDVCFQWDAPNPFFAAGVKTETLFDSFKKIMFLVADSGITTSLIYRLSSLRDALYDAEGNLFVDNEQAVKLFKYEVKHSFPHADNEEEIARRLAGLCVRPTKDGFNPEAPVVAHFFGAAASGGGAGGTK